MNLLLIDLIVLKWLIDCKIIGISNNVYVCALHGKRSIALFLILGLWGQGSVSFESVSRPGHYLVHRVGKVQ